MEAINGAFPNKSDKANFGFFKNVGVQEENYRVARRNTLTK